MSYYVLDYRIGSYLDPLHDRLTQDYLSFIYPEGGKPATKCSITKVRHAVGCFLYNAVRSLRFNVYKETVVLDKNLFSKFRLVNGRPIKRKVPYETFRDLLKWLDSEGVISLQIGGVIDYKTDPVTQSLIPALTCGSDIIYQDEFIDIITPYIEKGHAEKLENVIRMKNSDHKEIQFKMTDNLRSAKETIDCYNALAVDIKVKQPITNTYYKIQGFKVYNNSSDKVGGRTYLEGGSIQTMKSIHRKDILINDEKCVEYDFSALHPSLLCEMMGYKMPDDFKPYGIKLDGFDPIVLRKIAKQALLIMINTETKTQAQNALRKWVRENLEVDKLHSEGKVPFTIDTSEVLNKLFQHNEMIRGFLCSGNGLSLQNKDSRIMDLVIDHFTMRDIVIIPIHDSIILQERYEHLAIPAMEAAFESVMGSKMNCRIEKK